MKIIKPHDRYGRITCIIAGRRVCAKVYNEPSCLGINEGRVSKCEIYKPCFNQYSGYSERLDYHYCRGLDFHNDNLSIDILNQIVSELENLPLLDLD